MKPLILSTRNIIPTGNKERPVVVRRTWSSTLINVLLGMLLLTFSVLHICVSGVEHTFRFYFTSALSAHVILMYFTHAVKGEHPENNLDTEEFTCLQQYALFIWKERLKSASLAVALICCCFSDDDLVGVIGILFLAFFHNDMVFQTADQACRTVNARPEPVASHTGCARPLATGRQVGEGGAGLHGRGGWCGSVGRPVVISQRFQ